REPHRPTYPWSRPPNRRWSSISRPPRRDRAVRPRESGSRHRITVGPPNNTFDCSNGPPPWLTSRRKKHSNSVRADIVHPDRKIVRAPKSPGGEHDRDRDPGRKADPADPQATPYNR